jgi:iron complex outermembrane receptor protein
VAWTTGVNYSKENADQRSGIDLSALSVDRLVTEREVGFPYEAVTPGFGFDTAWAVAFPDESRIYSSGAEALASGDRYQEYVDVSGEYESYAAFMDVTYSLTDNLDITAGVRYTKDEKEFGRRVKFNDFGMAFAFTEESKIDENGNLDPNGTVGYYYQDESWSETTPRVVVDYRLTDDLMFYASWAEGYKAGGFNSAGERNDDPAFDPEEVTNVEFGIKSSWLDDTLRVNAAYFDYEYDNLQALEFIPGECIDGATTGQYQFVTSDVEGDGFELSANWLALNSLELWVNTGTVDAEYVRRSRRRSIDGVCEVIDESGETFADSPDLNYNIGATYTYDFGSGAELQFAVAWSYADGAEGGNSCTFVEDNGNGTSSVYGLDTVDGTLRITDPSATGDRTEAPFSSCPDRDDTEMLNMKLTYVSPNGNWEIAGWVTNATDWEPEGDPGGLGGELASDYTDGSPSYDRREEPRMYGMELKYSF